MTRRPEDIQGFEYDWLAFDADGHLAFLSTAGGGYAPPQFLEDIEAYDVAIDAILVAPATTTVRFAPEVAPGLDNTWQRMAERGLFAYDSDIEGGPYRLVAAPELPATVRQLASRVGEVARRVVLHELRFAASNVITADVIRSSLAEPEDPASEHRE